MGTGLDLSAGAIVGRDFRVVRPLAAGGMGAVFVVEQLSTGKQRALKVMHARFAADPRSRGRFEFEARASARLATDHVVEVVAAGVDEATNVPWMVMELLDGETLDAALSRRGPLPLAEAHEVFAQLGHALAAAHAAGIVHRDLKPENVVLATPRRAGAAFTVKVLDFGIAKLLTEGAGSNTQAIGTPEWMAPEQTVSGSAIAAPTDVWALGLIAYTVLTGVPYWRNAQVVATNPLPLFVEVGAEPLPPASQRAAEQGHAHLLPPGFDAWFARCVVREMLERFPDGAQATAALLPLLQAQPQPRASIAFAPTEGQPVFTLPPPVAAPVAMPRTMAMSAAVVAPSWSPSHPLVSFPQPAPPPRRYRRRGALWAGVGALLLLAGAGAAIALYHSPDPATGPATGPSATPTPPGTTPAAEEPEAGPLAAGQRWVGSYVCAATRTPMVLRVVSVAGHQVGALFEFTTAAGAEGVYRMLGTYIPATRRLTLSPGEWVRQPPGYTAVSMDGTVAPNDESYTGRMVHAECEGFALELADE